MLVAGLGRRGFIRAAAGVTAWVGASTAATATIDTVSHEGILEDQGRDPEAWFGERGVARADVLDDAVATAREHDRTARNATSTDRTW